MKKQYPIIFVHGFGGGKYEFSAMEKFFAKRGLRSCYYFEYAEKLGEISITILAERLAKFIAEVKEKERSEKVILIGFSQGGIIAKYSAEHYANGSVDKCVTICSPHKGSLWAKFLRSEGGKDLRKESDILKSLEKTKTSCKYYAFYTPFDLMVVPGTSGKSEHAISNKMILSPVHNVTMFMPSLLRAVYDIVK